MSILASRWFRTSVSLALLAAVIWIVDWRAILDVLSNVQLQWVAWATVVLILDRVIINFRFQLLLAIRNLKIGFLRLLRIQWAANLLGSFLPSSLGVDAIRIAALCRHGLAAADVVAATIVDRTTIMIARMIFGSVMLFVLAGTRVPEELTWLILAATALLGAACMVVLHPAVRGWASKQLLARLPQRIRAKTAEVASATLAYRHEPRMLLYISVITIALFLLRVLFALMLAFACGADVDYVDLLLVIPLLWMLVSLPITLGGIGLQDAGYVALLALVGVPAAIAVSMSLIEHVLVRLVFLPGAFLLSDVTGDTSSRTPKNA